MGIQIDWGGFPLDMSKSAQSLKDEMLAYIKGTNSTFSANYNGAENAFEEDGAKYPIENLDKMEEKFQDFLKEILRQDLSSFIRSLPEKKIGKDNQTKILQRLETMEDKRISDLLDSNLINIISGTGAFQFGRGMEGIPSFNFFESELGEPSVKIDTVIKQSRGKKQLDFVIQPKSGDKDDADITISYPAKQDTNAILDAKVAHLSKHGIFNPQVKNTKRQTMTVEEGELVLQLPETLFNKAIQDNQLVRDTKIKEVEMLEEGYKGLERERSPTVEEIPFITEALIEMRSGKGTEQIVEIDGKNYAVKLGSFQTFDLSPHIKREVDALFAENEEKFKQALSPLLDNPSLVASAIIEMNIVTKITPVEAGVAVTVYDEPLEDDKIIELAETFTNSAKTRIAELKKQLTADRKTLEEIEEVYSEDYEAYRERRAKLIEEKNALSQKEELSDEEQTAVAEMTQRIKNATEEMKAMLKDKKTVTERIKKYENALEQTEAKLEGVKDALKAGNYERVQSLTIELEDPTVEVSTQAERIKSQRRKTGIKTFKDRWDEGFPVLYRLNVEKRGEFDLNPFKRAPRSPKSFDKGVFDSLKTVLNSINRLKDIID